MKYLKIFIAFTLISALSGFTINSKTNPRFLIKHKAFQKPQEGSFKMGATSCIHDTFDSNHKKNGLWIEMKAANQVFYKHGFKNGPFINYYPNHRVAISGEFRNNTICGNWYFWNECGSVSAKFSQFTKNQNIYITIDKSSLLFHHKCRVKLYNKVGGVYCEGYCVYNDLEMETYQIGNWRYYNEDGKYIGSKNYIKGQELTLMNVGAN